MLTFINKIKFFGERWEEAAMRKLAILIGAAVLGLGLGAGHASAKSNSLLKLSDICNSTLSENTDVKNPAADYVSSDCVITVRAPFKLVIDGVDFATGEGANLEIVGEGDAELKIKKSEIYVDGNFVISFMFGNVKLADNDDTLRVLNMFVIETQGGDIDINNNDVFVYVQDFEIEAMVSH